ncbi:hypothetical protein DCS_02440 [Drechmeria coniospora]|uniref:Uncharacterized protein n=1 Tax=Drechmeria coniospora TaxID=98403 RepID=A0A151GW20_DRECN|nr:hypothetical protein DCS_02440 [Drechmeria coniospora]KYK61298.1 hypothetical protein DCS_02440 [Drechmeria coniospora]ODA81061.1 hypothetical protein RJ55_04023 [Drechmeria coniospora]
MPERITTSIPAHSSHSSQDKTSPRAKADAARAMDHTISWQPSMQRRQSWSKEDQKHQLQMSTMDTANKAPGFTEKR